VSNRKKAVQISGLKVLFSCLRKVVEVSDQRVDLAICLIRSVDLLLDEFRMYFTVNPDWGLFHTGASTRGKVISLVLPLSIHTDASARIARASTRGHSRWKRLARASELAKLVTGLLILTWFQDIKFTFAASLHIICLRIY